MNICTLLNFANPASPTAGGLTDGSEMLIPLQKVRRVVIRFEAAFDSCRLADYTVESYHTWAACNP